VRAQDVVAEKRKECWWRIEGERGAPAHALARKIKAGSVIRPCDPYNHSLTANARAPKGPARSRDKVFFFLEPGVPANGQTADVKRPLGPRTAIRRPDLDLVCCRR